MNIILLLVLFVASMLLTLGLRYYAITHDIIDVPNARSSHSMPTPRGGGVAIVLTMLAGLAWLAFTIDNLWWLAVAGALVALIGWLDDHGHVNARWRLLVHFLSSALIVYSLGGLPPLVFLGLEQDLGWIGHILAVIALVWLLNLYNFMDGIDGIASIEAVTASGLGAVVLATLGTSVWLVQLHWLMAVCVLGFLVWNFPPARIFMGDAGSGFLGLMVGALTLASSHVAPQMLWVWLIMLGVFVVDATFTLIRRLLRGDKVYEAHRSHAYQYASRHFGAHMPVTLGVLAINALWLAPMACLAAFGVIDGFGALLVAFVPLVVLAVKFKAGALE